MLFAFYWRVEGLDRESLWRDEVDAIYFALADFQSLLSMFVEPGHNGPLYFLSLRYWLKLVGSSEFALRYLSLLLGILAIPLTWQVGRRLLPAPAAANSSNLANESTGCRRSIWQIFINDPSLLAAAFLAVSPYQLWYSQEGKMYTATTFIVLVATWFWLKGVTRRSGPSVWLWLIMIVTVGFYVHLLLALLLPLLTIWFLITFRRNGAWAIGLPLAMLFVIAALAFRASWLWQLLNSSDSVAGRPFFPFRFTLQETLRYQFNGVLSPTQDLDFIHLIDKKGRQDKLISTDEGEIECLSCHQRL